MRFPWPAARITAVQFEKGWFMVMDGAAGPDTRGQHGAPKGSLSGHQRLGDTADKQRSWSAGYPSGDVGGWTSIVRRIVVCVFHRKRLTRDASQGVLWQS